MSRDRIPAVEIIERINDGQDVHYENVEIVGDVDFTTVYSDDMADEDTSCIDVLVAFVNCLFTGTVAGYNEDNLTSFAQFENDVTFAGCRFEGSVDHSYARFFGAFDCENVQFAADVSFAESAFVGQTCT